MPRYTPSEIEPKWQAYWEHNRTFACPRLPSGPKMYVLDMFPYPSGEGLHVGHPEGYTATDIVCRYKRMRGYSVLHPMGFDAFGLPAEQHAKKTGTPPRITTEKNIANFRRQLKMLGFSYDWDRELSTTDVAYFRWTQWIFLLLYDTWYDAAEKRGRPISELPLPDEVLRKGSEEVSKYQNDHRLAYEAHAPVNWCPALGTVLANEEVIDGKSERGNHPVVRLPLRQWMLRITAYADRLEDDLQGLDWSEGIKKRQCDWIGRSTGAEVDFYIGPGDSLQSADAMPETFTSAFNSWKQQRKESGFPKKADDSVLRVYTTRPDTLFGATYMVIAPEHTLVLRLTSPDRLEHVNKYREEAARKSEMDRTELAKDKTGVFTGSYAINPVNGRPIPIWIADYVLANYGSGAIMAVPAHDKRDFEFAVKFKLPITPVVAPGEHLDRAQRDQIHAGKLTYSDEGTAIHSGPYDGLATATVRSKITQDLSECGLGKQAVNYKLRDWLFSRQHFWGEPFPLVHKLTVDGQRTGNIKALQPEDLPVDLPELARFDTHGSPEPPLEQAPESWLYPVIDGERYKRETNTMPQWAGSCWYYLRFIDPKNAEAFVDRELEKAWMPVDLYVGGAEHAVLHLLYSRFWHKVLFDRGYVSTREPFQKLVNQGMILGEVEFTAYQSDGRYVSANDVSETDAGEFVHKPSGQSAVPISVAPKDCVKQGEHFVLAADPGIRLISRAFKMSKSRGNVVNPDVVVKEYGADSLRLYEMFMGPLEAVKPWSMDGVNGVRGFLDRFWRLIVNDRAETIELSPALVDAPPTDEQLRVVHRTIAGVTEDLDRMAFNTSIAKLMEFTNFFFKQDKRPRWAMEQGVLLLAPLAPHLAEELWSLLGHGNTLAYEPWPSADPAYLKDDVIEMPVQVNGKLRGVIKVPADVSAEQAEAAALNLPNVAEHLQGKTIVKKIVAPGKMVNFVVK